MHDHVNKWKWNWNYEEQLLMPISEKVRHGQKDNHHMGSIVP